MNPPRNGQGAFHSHAEPVVSSIEGLDIIGNRGAGMRHNPHGFTEMRAATRAQTGPTGRRSLPAMDAGPVQQPGRERPPSAAPAVASAATPRVAHVPAAGDQRSVCLPSQPAGMALAAALAWSPSCL
jgi:hypothetical protein